MQDNLSEILKQQLRDIHLPEQIGWWPLAYGWWMLIVIAVISLVALVVLLIRKRQSNLYRKFALTELGSHYAAWQQNKDNALYLQSANNILKRCVLQNNDDPTIAKLSGQQWIYTLDLLSNSSLSNTVRSALAVECYKPKPAIDIDRTHNELVNWLKSHRRQINRQRRDFTAEASHA